MYVKLRNALAISNVRLEEGSGRYEGRVEVSIAGIWGTICDDGFDMDDAKVVCRMLNMSATGFLHQARRGQGSGPIYLRNLACEGHETNINQCSYGINVSVCSHSDDVSVICSEIQNMRLANGIGLYDGRIEIQVNGSWGLICGYSSQTRYYFSDVRLAPGPYHGRVELKVNNTWGTVCGNGFDNNDANVISDIRRRALNITEARIINGTSPYIGRAEIKVNGTWGTICDNGFHSYDTSTTCKMLGLKGADVYSNARYGQGSGPVFIDDLICYSYSASLNECRYLKYNLCSHQRDVSVACYGPHLNISEVRLVNGTGPDDGRAEILVDGKWGTICDDSFDISNTEAFCAMLGKKGAQFFTAAYHGQGTGPVYIDRLDCQSASQALSDCPYLYTNTCRVLELTCDNVTKKWITNGECQEYRFPLDVADIRLVNGSVPGSGRVELKSMNTWGTICGDGFDMDAANVICQMIGFPPAKTFYRSAYFGPGFGPIFVDDLACGASATHINNCSYITEDNCNHNNDISVVCTGPLKLYAFICKRNVVYILRVMQNMR
ncbi:DMBT1-like protein [Mya arenaria]|uniref:DMBT1-like protein n=1 Tax=Mya arenaria TaxID=6604 RepID=A0ABY7FSC7_MYAAR|nr:DMBT1-like protein [Mya arenaria]